MYVLDSDGRWFLRFIILVWQNPEGVSRLKPFQREFREHLLITVVRTYGSEASEIKEALDAGVQLGFGIGIRGGAVAHMRAISSVVSP